MSDAISVSGPINAAGLEMTLETGKLASLAAGAVVVKVGGTTLLSTVATSKPREGIDFFPLTVDVEERAYAAARSPVRSSVAKVAPASSRSSPVA